MKGRMTMGALVAGALAIAVAPAQADNQYGTVRMSPAAPHASPPQDQPVGTVPVPGTVALLALGGVGISIVRRVKSRRRVERS